jgi:hypothetical protein
MKTISIKGLIAGVLTIVSTNAIGQAYLEDPRYGADVETRKLCAEKTSMYQEYYKQNNIKDAYAPWQKVLNICPKQSLNVYIRGVKILKAMYENTADPKRKAVLVDSLMSLYDMRIEHFNKKGMFWI